MSGSIRVSQLGKRLPRYRDDRSRTLKELMMRGWRSMQPIERFWALRDINFAVEPGQMLGVVGHNGSGKSTLLRMLGGVMRPDAGTIRTIGPISGLLGLNAGLHPDLTGRDNIIINGVIAGLSRREVEARLDEIVAFAELEQFIDSPVRIYSAGMKMRLGFAVSAHVRPGILLIDEVLSVGDMAFQQKGLDRIRHYKELGSAIVLVTHDLSQVEALCDSALWLREGRQVAHGDPEVVLGAYRSEMSSESRRRTPRQVPDRFTSGGVRLGANENRFGSMEAEILDLEILDDGGSRLPAYRSGDPLAIAITLSSAQGVRDPLLSVSISSDAHPHLVDLNTAADGYKLPAIEGTSRVVLHLDRLDLIAGEYHIDVGVYESNWAYAYDYHWHAYPLKVLSDSRSPGIVSPPRKWVCEPVAEEILMQPAAG